MYDRFTVAFFLLPAKKPRHGEDEYSSSTARIIGLTFELLNESRITI
jgi:hypothetical protein